MQHDHLGALLDAGEHDLGIPFAERRRNDDLDREFALELSGDSFRLLCESSGGHNRDVLARTQHLGHRRLVLFRGHGCAGSAHSDQRDRTGGDKEQARPHDHAVGREELIRKRGDRDGAEHGGRDARRREPEDGAVVARVRLSLDDRLEENVCGAIDEPDQADQ